MIAFGMRRLALSLGGALALVSLAVPAAAGTLRIAYGITGGTVVVPPGATIKGGMYTVEFEASGIATIVSGPAVLKTFSFSGSDFTVTYGDVLVTNFTVQLNPGLAGIATLAGGFWNAATANFAGVVGVHCSGGTCPSGGFVQSVTKFFSLVVSAPSSNLSIDGNGAHLVGGYEIVGVTADQFSVSFTGQEISRTFMPEPRPHWLVLAAVGSIAAIEARSRRARASSLRAERRRKTVAGVSIWARAPDHRLAASSTRFRQDQSSAIPRKAWDTAAITTSDTTR